MFRIAVCRLCSSSIAKTIKKHGAKGGDMAHYAPFLLIKLSAYKKKSTPIFARGDRISKLATCALHFLIIQSLLFFSRQYSAYTLAFDQDLYHLWRYEMSAPGSSNPSGSPPQAHDGYDGEEGPHEIFLDDDDIAELQAVMDEEGDFPMEDDDDDVEEVTEAPDDFEGTEGQHEHQASDEMDEAIPDQALRHFTAHEKAVFSVSAHPTCPVLVVTGGEDDNGFLWRTDTGEEMAKLTGHTDSVITTGWSSDGEMVATGGMDGLVRVWRRVKPAPGQWEWSRWEFLTVLEGMDEVTVSSTSTNIALNVWYPG